MNTQKTTSLFLAFFLASAFWVQGKPVADTLSLPPVQADTLTVPSDTAAAKKGFFRKFIDYFADANKEKPYKKFDFSIIGGPNYSEDTKFGIGLVAAGLYRLDPSDSLLAPSDVSLYGNVSTSGFYLVGIRGNNLFPGDRYRLLYNMNFFSFPGAFWGIGYQMGDQNANESQYTLQQYSVKLNFLIRTARNFYIGPIASYDYIEGKKFDRIELLEGQDRVTQTIGAGVTLAYDTRDVSTAPARGIYVKGEQRFFPAFLGNRYAFSRTDLIFDGYKSVWKGGVLAFDFHSEFNYGRVPWTMLATLGGSYSMRGYYDGRYRDRNLIEAQVELRQKVWRRNGIALWVGAGNVFHDFDTFRWSQTLPNFGVGYRWEFKKRVNVRLDLGFGRNGSGFIFNINEAF